MGFGEKIKVFFQGLLGKLGDWFKGLTGEKKHRFILICTAGFAVILTFSVIISMGKSASDDSLEAGVGEAALSERYRLNFAIPAEELFLPDEPDFLPNVMLGRDRRTSWTEEDAELYWQDPLRSGEEQWRKKIEAAIDEFLERVP
ncbi:MAG: hypothetical protein LBU66_03470 [Treponema sp.]|jgi:hypothetical protein|nr:hypothetical protein [Treponema sp.]